MFLLCLEFQKPRLHKRRESQFTSLSHTHLIYSHTQVLFLSKLLCFPFFLLLLIFLPNMFPFGFWALLTVDCGDFGGIRVLLFINFSENNKAEKMQQTPQMIPMMPSFPPTNITTEQIQKVFFFFFTVLIPLFPL